MKRLLGTLIVLALIGTGCATLHNRYHWPDGSLNVPAMIGDARWGLSAGCLSTWVPPADCALAHDALDVADRIAVSDTPGAAAAVRQALVTFEARLMPENRIRPYLDWLILLLPSA